MIGGLSPLVRLRDFNFGRMRVLLAGGVYLKAPAGTYTLETEDYESYVMKHSGASYSLKSQGGSYGYPVLLGIGQYMSEPVIPLDGSGHEVPIDPSSWDDSWEDLSTQKSQYIEGDHYKWPLESVSFVSNLTVYKLHDVFSPMTNTELAYSFGNYVAVYQYRVNSDRAEYVEIWRSASGVNLTHRRDGSRLLVVEAKKLRLTYNPLPDVLANLEHFGQRLEVWLETEISGGSREWRRLFRSAPAAQVSIGPLQDAGFVDEDGYIVRMPEAGAALPVYGRNALGPYSKIDQFNPSRAS